MAKPKSTPSTFLTVREVAERLCFSEKTIRRAISARELRAYSVGRSVRIADADVAAFMALRLR